MKADKVAALLKALGGNVTSQSDDWVMCQCVFAPFTHNGGVDNNPSSRMSVKKNSYSCFTCQQYGSSYAIYKKLKALYRGNPPPKVNFKKALKIIDALDDGGDVTFPDYEEEINCDPKVLIPFDENWWQGFPKAYQHPYIVYRGISKKTAKQIDIRLDFNRNRLVFPIRDWSGVLMGMHGRTFLQDEKLRYYSYPCNGVRNPSVWMGEHHVDLDEPVILTEGQFDYANVFPIYENVLSGQTSSVGLNKLKRIAGASEIITAYDVGQGGDHGRESVDKFFKGVPITHLTIPKKYGDLGNMPPKAIYKMLASIA